METCLTRNQLPRNMRARVEPHIYRSNQTVEQEWKEILHNASLNLLTALIRHFPSIIKQESTKMRDLEQQVHTLIGSSSELKELWTTKYQEATQQAKQLSEDLKINREKKLSFRQKRYQSQDEHTPETKRFRYEQRPDPNIVETIKSVMLQLQSSSSKSNHPPTGGGGELQTKRTRQRQKIPNKKQKATRKKRTYRNNRHKCIDAYSESCMLFNESLIEPYNKSNVNTNKEDNEIVLLAPHPTITNTHLNILRKGLSFIPRPKLQYSRTIQ